MTRRNLAVAVVDYGAGNLHSLTKALAAPGISVAVETDASHAAERGAYDLLVLPGVGAFTGAAEHLAASRDAIRAVVEDGLPVLGICLGMQLLFDESEEGPGRGLGLIPGAVRRLRARRVPQIGWNTVQGDSPDWSASHMPRLDVAYYANSYVCEPRNPSQVAARSSYEDDCFPAIVCGGPARNVIGMQFHPEKSSAAGVAFLRAMVDFAVSVARR